jgi:membrane protein
MSLPHNWIRDTLAFLKRDLWHLDKKDLSPPWSYLLKPLRIVVLAAQDFVSDRCMLRASALTFYSLLSVVPVAAMALGIAQGFGLEERLAKHIHQWLPGQGEAVETILGFARSLLASTRKGVVAGIGVLVLFWSATRVLAHIEAALNDIWKVKGRSFLRKLTDYLALMIVSPLLVVASSSLNIFIANQVADMTSGLAILRKASPVIFSLLNLLPYGLLWILFFLIYRAMPNARVGYRSALIAGIIGGTLYQLTQNFYVSTQMLVANFNAVYGSFAALPLFLVWLQLSWMIVLLGAQIAHAGESVGTYAMNIQYQTASQAARKQCALRIMQAIIRPFERGEPAPTAETVAAQLHLSRALAEDLLHRLMAAGMVSAVDGEETLCYQPARDIHGITVAGLFEAWDRLGQDPLRITACEGCEPAQQAVEEFYAEMRCSPANRLIKDL